MKKITKQEILTKDITSHTEVDEEKNQVEVDKKS